jgi:hypothetical protein
MNPMGNKYAKAPAQRPAPIDPELLEASAGEALERVRDAGDRATALVEGWTERNNAVALAAVADAPDIAGPVRKAARRALATLRSRGINVPERRPGPAATAPADALAPSATEAAWFLPGDQSGVAVYTIGTRAVGERWKVVDVQLHEAAGIIDLSVGEAPDSNIRDSHKRARQGRGFEPVAVPVEWARWRVARARERNAASGLVPPLGFDVAAPLLASAPQAEPAHPIDAAGLAVPAAELETRAGQSGSLHNEPEFAQWLPEIQFVQELLGKVGERLGPTEEERTQDKITAAFESEIASATDRFFTPDVRERLAARMKDCALSVLARAGRERALDVLATAEAARRAGLITSPPSDIPFLRAFFQKALAVVASSSGGKISVPVRGPEPAPDQAAPEGGGEGEPAQPQGAGT